VASNEARILTTNAGILQVATNSNALVRFEDNQVDYYVCLDATVVQTPTVPDDYFLTLPYPIATSNYRHQAVFGDMCARVVTPANDVFTYPLTVRTNSCNANTAILRLLSGTTETYLSVLTSNTKVQIMGQIQYVTTAFAEASVLASQDFIFVDCNLQRVGIRQMAPVHMLDVNGDVGASNLYLRGTIFQNGVPILDKNGLRPWTLSSNAVSFEVPPSIQLAYSSNSNSFYRRVDDHVDYYVNVSPTLTSNANPVAAAGDFYLSLPVPVQTAYYINGSVLGGELYGRVSWSRCAC
jgi:hypothetical protein